MNYTEFATNKLKDNGFKITKTRKFVIDALAKTAKPLNAYQISKIVSRSGEKIDTVTVYRILEVFKKLGLVHFIKETQGFMPCQEFGCVEHDHCHHQFVCKKCEKVQEVHIEDKDFLRQVRSKLKGGKIDGHYFEFLGYCTKCSSLKK